jgi:hypothetical protein
MSIKKSQIEDKSISPQNQEEKNKEKRPNNTDTYQEFNYPGQVTIKAKNKKEADKKFNELNNK